MKVSDVMFYLITACLFIKKKTACKAQAVFKYFMFCY